jgi:hypothetical protein
MITRKNEKVVPGATVSHILEIRSVDQTLDEEGLLGQGVTSDPTLGERVLHKTSTRWGMTSGGDYTDDYHSGLVRAVPVHQSNYLARERGMDHLMVWNERAISICIMQELARVAEILGVQAQIEKTSANQLANILGLKNEDELRRLISRDHLAEVIIGMVIGANILVDDPHGNLRQNMNNGNVVGFLGSDSDFSRAAIIVSSYNTPCAKPAWRLRELFPEIEEPQVHEETFSKSIKKVLSPYHGWLGGVFSPGEVHVGDKVFVNIAPTTPPLPEEL